MSWIYVLLSIVIILILLIALALFLPIHLIIEYDEDLNISLKILFFKLNLYRDINQNNKSFSTSKSVSDDKEFSLKSIIKKIREFGIVNFLSFTVKAINISGEIIYDILRKTNINDIVFSLEIGGKDAHSTAILFAQASEAVNIIYKYVNSIKVLKSYEISVKPNFISKKNFLDLKLNISSRLYDIIITFVKYIKDISRLLSIKRLGDNDE